MPSPCPACGAALEPGLKPWHLACGQCSYEGSALNPTTQGQADEARLDETARELSLGGLRKKNFQRLRRRIESHLPAPPGRETLLDVGCAHGWFLDACRGRFVAIGIEPDAAISAAARQRGLPVRTGYFPGDVAAGESFDVIAFNDALEHIADLDETFAACHRLINAGGLLVVNAPSRRGVLYRLSRLLVRLGAPGPFERLWQRGFPSPHLHYFDTSSLSRIAARHGFELVSRSSLPSVAVRGLYTRIRFARGVSAAKAGLMASVITLSSPLLALLPADIGVWIFRRADVGATDPTLT